MRCAACDKRPSNRHEYRDFRPVTGHFGEVMICGGCIEMYHDDDRFEVVRRCC